MFKYVICFVLWSLFFGCQYFVFFFFKQKTAYEMRISDWSSDVCSSDLFVEILNRVKSDYVEPVEDKTLIENAVRGMLAGLDPHSAYLDEDEFKDMNVITTGKFGGLGIEVQMQDGFVRVVRSEEQTSELQSLMRISYAVF